MKILILYIVGFLTTYIFLKRIRNKQGFNEWADVKATLVMSTFSWVGLPIVLFILYNIGGKILDIFSEILGKIKETKPPKWM